MAGLIEEGFRLRGDAMQGYGDVGAMKQSRDELNYRLKAQHDAATGEMYGTIAGALTSGALQGLEAMSSSTKPAITKEMTSVGGKGTGAVFPPGAIKNAPVTQGALPQSPSGMAPNTNIFPQGTIRNAPAPQAPLPQSTLPIASSSNWWDNLTSW